MPGMKKYECATEGCTSSYDGEDYGVELTLALSEMYSAKNWADGQEERYETDCTTDCEYGSCSSSILGTMG